MCVCTDYARNDDDLQVYISYISAELILHTCHKHWKTGVLVHITVLMYFKGNCCLLCHQ